MRGFFAVFKKELHSYLTSPIAYVLAAVFLVLMGFLFRNLVMQFNAFCLTYFSQAARFGGQLPELNLNRIVVESFFGLLGFISLFMIPMLTMRLYAEEKKLGTFELLTTSPISNLQTILGKFSACFVLYAGTVGLTLVMMGLLDAYGEPDWGPIVSSYLGVLLLGASFVAIGILASSLTENQIVAVAISFGALLLFWLMGWASQFASGGLRKVMEYLSIIDHMEDFYKGVIDTKDVLFYLSFTFFSLFLTAVVLESRKWRGVR
ncbi:MAG TPA: ABC transporter [Candidatus Latescibacteria bacterium]|nr:ABC transporter [Candidatus Latescibacterota bacterium]